MEEELANIGATIMGRNMFGGGPGPWSKTDPWNGWWGRNPPFHHPVFVLTHHAREPLMMQGGTSFTFVTDGIESALDQARRGAGGKDVALSGGARTAQQYLKAGLVDEMQVVTKGRFALSCEVLRVTKYTLRQMGARTSPGVSSGAPCRGCGSAPAAHFHK